MKSPLVPAMVIAAAALPLLAGCDSAWDPWGRHPLAESSSSPTASAPQEVSMAEETKTTEEWRQRRIGRLTAPDGWLSLVGLEWLDEGKNRLGNDENADVRFPARAPATIGTITRHGGELLLEPAPGVPLTIGGKPVTAPTKLQSDADGTADPTTVELGSIEFFVIQRGDRWAVRIKDAESPVRQSFKGIDYYPITPQWRVVGRFEPAPKGSTMQVPNILGTVEDAVFPGTFVFTHDGQEVRLRAIDEGDGRLFIVFGDTTNGKGTYGGGRFVYAPPPRPGEPVVLDFNQAYNPPCVFTPFATCPLPPPGNKMAFAVEAGEKLWAGYHHPG